MRRRRFSSKCISCCPMMSWAPHHPGQRLRCNVGKLEKAITYFQKALKILPSYADAHNNLAAAYVEMGRLPEALPHLEQAARLNARDPMAHTNLGAVLAGLGRISEARSHLHQGARQPLPIFPGSNERVGCSRKCPAPEPLRTNETIRAAARQNRPYQPFPSQACGRAFRYFLNHLKR